MSDVVFNGHEESSYAGCINLSFAYVEGESLLMALKDIALSSGRCVRAGSATMIQSTVPLVPLKTSACTSASLEPSYVLRAIGAAEDLAHSSIRFGIGRFTTEQEVDFVIDKVVRHTQRLRDMSPLWEMKQQGIDISKINWSKH